MLDVILTGGLVIVFAGVVQTVSRRRRASAVDLLQEGMVGFHGSDAEAFRAEFRRSGVELPERRGPVGFF